jgi:hypothetical protein
MTMNPVDHLVAYSYLEEDEHRPHYTVSRDQGHTWSEVQTTFLAKRIRNPQISQRIGGLYFLHGRSGHTGDDPRHLVLYTSTDAIHWDEGVFLNKGSIRDLDSYSTNEVIGKYDPETSERLLIQSSIAYDPSGRRVNLHHWWVEPASDAAPGYEQGAECGTAGQTSGRLLYNGIRLPETWPPDHLDPKSLEPMAVPYLEQPPEVIPIHVGRQLFVDDFLIQQTDLSRSYHAAERYAGNPVYQPESDEELRRNGTVYLGHGGVFFDPADQLFKMFYTAGWRGPLAMATSPDLIRWTRPVLSPGGDNVLIRRSVDDNSIWLDLQPGAADQRWKYLECHRSKGHFLYTSPDGLAWSAGVNAGQAGDYCSFFYNPFRQVWVYSIKRDTRGRNRYYHEHPDFLQGSDWAASVYWCGADRLDLPEPQGRYPGSGEPTQLYSLNAVAYESLLVGMHYIHRGPNNRICAEGQFPKLTDLEVGFSRDGFHWHRPSREPFLAGTRREGDWDRAYMHSTTGVLATWGDRLVFPYTAFSGIAPDGSRGMYHGGSIGLAFLRRDGFASMDAGPDGGTLTTRPVVFRGTRLFVNAKVPEGELRAEVLDMDGQPIAPFTLANSLAVTGDSTLIPVTWAGGADLGRLAGKRVRFRFSLTGGSLYAFWVSQDDTGRSDGYVGVGGPGYEGVIDTTGRAALQATGVEIMGSAVQD